MNISFKRWLAVACLLLGVITAALAQSAETEKLLIPLSQPGKPGLLRASLLQGSITVTGHKGKDVVINYSTREEKGKEKPRTNPDAEGLRRLPNNNVGLEVREENNQITIKNNILARSLDLQIQVPADFSVKLKTLNDGVILVEDVNGELEVDNLNGNIILRNVAGSASVSTLNGDIIANFKKVTANMPMAFSSLNGKIDVTLPPAAKFNAKLKSDNGEIFTDFDMAMDKSQPGQSTLDKGNSLTPSKLRNTEPAPGTRINVDKWLYGKLNGGGPDILFKNFNGNIYIRKSK